MLTKCFVTRKTLITFKIIMQETKKKLIVAKAIVRCNYCLWLNWRKTCIKFFETKLIIDCIEDR